MKEIEEELRESLEWDIYTLLRNSGISVQEAIDLLEGAIEFIEDAGFNN